MIERLANLNLIDRAVSYLSPRAGLKRAHARMALSLTEGYLERHAQRFGYEGAAPGRRTSGWYTSSADANVELMGSLVWLRNRSRDLVRNNPYATKALEELVGNGVGTGIVPQSKTGDTKLDKVIDNEWSYFADACDTPQRLDFYGLEALVMRSMAESGESISRFRPRLEQDKLRVPLQIQILESDFLDHARTMGTQYGHVMQGVEFDLIGRRVAYWLYTYHPGGVLILNPRGGIISQRIPAEQIMHTYRVLRPGQVRGVPWLTPSMIALRDLDDWCDAERIRKKIEACVVAFVTQPEGRSGSPLGITAENDPYKQQDDESFEPGMVKYLKNGQSVNFNNPHAVGGYREYKMTELQGIMAGIGIPYELGSGDMSNVNFSSWRGGMLGFRNTIEAFRWLSLIPGFCMPVRRRFIDTLILTGVIPSSAAEDPKLHVYGTQWTAPRFESVDPVKDAEARLKEIRMGLTTWAEAVVANGYDPEKQLRDIATFNKAVDDMEIILDCDPRRTSLRGQLNAETPEEATDNKPVATKQKMTAVESTLDRIDSLAEHLATAKAEVRVDNVRTYLN